MILAHNCARMLPRALKRIPSGVVDEIFVTDDGSSDGSFEVAKQLGLRAYRHSPNRGYGGNVKVGLKIGLDLGADYVVEVHGDGQFDPSAIITALPLMDANVDFVLGSRFQDPKRALADGMSLVRFLGNSALSFRDRLVLGLPLTEFHTGFRIYSRRMIETIPFEKNSDDYLFSYQIIAQAAHYGISVAEVPVRADYLSEHTSCKLSGAMLYAYQSFGVLGDYLLAQRGVRYSAVFPRLSSSA